MRINVYTEELPNVDANDPSVAEIVYVDYISSRTGEAMRNYGLRIYLKSAPELHYVPPRDDDRSAVTFWCGTKEKHVLEFLDAIREHAYASTLTLWREKTMKQQEAAEQALKP